jgi:DNA-binding transcriptional LysR family regulator
MGIKLSVPDERMPYPRKVLMTLECDVGKEFFARGSKCLKVAKTSSCTTLRSAGARKDAPIVTFHWPGMLRKRRVAALVRRCRRACPAIKGMMFDSSVTMAAAAAQGAEVALLPAAMFERELSLGLWSSLST